MCSFNEGILVALILVGAQNGLATSNWHRSRRFLTFPPTSPTRVQVLHVKQYSIFSPKIFYLKYFPDY